jgi:site-specific DNA recombinase
VIEHVRRIIVGDGTLTITLSDGHKLKRAFERVRHGNDAKLIVGEKATSDTRSADPQLIILLRDAHRARALALGKPRLSLDELATRFDRSIERYKRLLRLSYLSPTIITAIIEMRQPPHITNRFLQNLDGLPLSWAAQERLLLG